jgi:transposase-like protein
MTKKSPTTKFTLKDFQQVFSSDDVCLEYIRLKRYPERIDCPKCGKNSLFHHDKNKKSYSCDHCGKQISPTAGTIFHKSPTALTLWFYVIYLMAQTRGGISAKQIQRETGVTYKTAWRMCKQIRSMLSEDYSPFTGEVEADESYFGGKEENKHWSKRTAGVGGRSVKVKTPVFGLVQRGGKLEARTVKDAKSGTLLPIVKANVRQGAEIYTDEYRAYSILPLMEYTHGVVSHQNRIYVDGEIHTNTIDGFWSQAKNGIRGVYHAVSAKYLQHYLDEYAFRYNHRKDVNPMFLSFLSLASSPLRAE